MVVLWSRVVGVSQDGGIIGKNLEVEKGRTERNVNVQLHVAWSRNWSVKVAATVEGGKICVECNCVCVRV